MTIVDTELKMPASLRAVGSTEFASTFIRELIKNVSELPMLDAALDGGSADEDGFYCSVAGMVRRGKTLTVTVDFEFGAAPVSSYGDLCDEEEAHGKFAVVLDIEHQRAYVIDEAA